MTHRLNDDELRDAAAGRPGYATYPEYRPSSRERLAPLRIRPTDATGHPVPVRRTAAAPVPAEPSPASRTWLDARLPLTPTPPPAVLLLASLPPRLFDFQPRRTDARPWWRPRWHWGVLTAAGQTRHGYAWTEAGAARRTARAARRAAR